MLDHCSEDGARALAARLMSYWRERGYQLVAWHVPIKTDVRKRRNADGSPGTHVFGVRSNMGPNGYPRALLVQQAA